MKTNETRTGQVMKAAPQRRDLLKAALGGAVSLAAPWPAFAQGAQGAPEFAVTRFGESLLAVGGPGFNVVAGVEPDGLVLVDGGPESHAAALLDFLYRETGRDRVKTLINTHWHREQTGLNQILGEAGAKIVAHENTRLWLSHDFHVWWQDRSYSPLPEAARPNETFYKTWESDFGEGGVEAAYLMKPHTDGDIYVRFPGYNVIASGGVGVADGWPVLDWGTGGWLGGLIDGLDALIAVSDDETRFVPERGPVVTRSDLQEQREMYSTILTRLAEMLRKSYGFAEVLAARPTAEFDDRWGDPEQFVTLSYRSTWGHIRGDRRVSTI